MHGRGDGALEPRRRRVTPSFYFGLADDLLPAIVPWLQRNGMGPTILLRPGTQDPCADPLYHALWVNRSRPVNAYAMRAPAAGVRVLSRSIPTPAR